MELYFTLFQQSFSIRDNYSLKYIPYPCGTVFDSLPSGVFNKRYLQPKAYSISLWNCTWLSPTEFFNKRYYSLKYIPYPCGTVFYTPPAKFSIWDNYSIKYLPDPCGTVFYTPPAEFSTRDNFSLKNIPYPCGTASHTLPVEFSKEIIQSKIHPISLWNCILHSPCRVFKRDNYSQKYIPHPCGTVFYNPPAEFSIIDTDSKEIITVNWNTFHTPLELYFTLSQRSFQQEIISV